MIKNNKFQSQYEEIATLDLPQRDYYKKEPVFYVNLNTREIEVPAAFKNLAVTGDHNAEIIWFQMSRYFDGVDLDEKNVAIQFQNSKVAMSIPAEFILNYQDDALGLIQENELLVGWKLTHEVSSVSGPLTFSLKIYSGDIDTQTFDYVLHTQNATVNILNGLNVTDTSEGLNPPLDTLSTLVNYIAALYRSQASQGIDYNTNIIQGTLPKIDDVRLRGDMSSANIIKNLPYANLVNKPTIDGTTFEGDILSSSFTNLSYAQLVEDSLPKVNGTILTAGTELEIVTTVDTELKDSENPVQNKVINSKFNEVDKSILDIEEQLKTLTFVPITISNFTNSLNVVELNDTTVKNIDFSWETSKTPSEITLNGTKISQNPYTLKTSITKDTTFTLEVKGVAATDVATATTEVKVVKGIFYGTAAAQDSYSETFIRELGGKILSTESEHVFTVDAGTDLDQYIYIAAPAADLYEFSVNSFIGGFTLVDDSVTLYNNVQYKIYKSDNKNLGITKVKLS